jgi:hypothetical protein
MTTITFKPVDNGYIVMENGKPIRVAKSLSEAAEHYGAPRPATIFDKYVNYGSDVNGAFELSGIRDHAKNGQKIDAIKRLRNLFGNHVLGLREAKDIVEILILGQL